ncbi:MAG: response regulator [Betaproteobacteria bacterium]|nr:response regulator [Betaproteobacteria bacterium]
MTPRILIADDEPTIVLSLEFLMRRSGFVVEVARDGDEAIAKATTFEPSLVLLDVMLPRRDGMEVCRALRANCGAGLKIVLLTAKGGQTDLDRGLSMGADLYIVKPFSTQDLVASVKQLLGADSA